MIQDIYFQIFHTNDTLIIIKIKNIKTFISKFIDKYKLQFQNYLIIISNIIKII